MRSLIDATSCEYGRGAPGLTTVVPKPWRLMTSPASRNSRSASRIVCLLTPNRCVSSLSVGSRESTGWTPVTISCFSVCTTRRYLGSAAEAAVRGAAPLAAAVRRAMVARASCRLAAILASGAVTSPRSGAVSCYAGHRHQRAIRNGNARAANEPGLSPQAHGACRARLRREGSRRSRADAEPVLRALPRRDRRSDLVGRARAGDRRIAAVDGRADLVAREARAHRAHARQRQQPDLAHRSHGGGPQALRESDGARDPRRARAVRRVRAWRGRRAESIVRTVDRERRAPLVSPEAAQPADGGRQTATGARRAQ